MTKYKDLKLKEEMEEQTKEKWTTLECCLCGGKPLPNPKCDCKCHSPTLEDDFTSSMCNKCKAPKGVGYHKCPTLEEKEVIALCKECNASFVEWLSDSNKCPECEGQMMFLDCLPHNDWEEEFSKLDKNHEFFYAKANGDIGYFPEKIKFFISNTIIPQERKEIMMGLTNLFDKLELNDPDKSTENWKNYKFIRNNIRDFIKNLSQSEE